ncbi:hypothetical protein AKO1_015258 [Acrasis kona]|uniref:Uncharacterized protein n=1 Tax=Acrasis kona TaxID=1008807 RepID=A0AAW2ZH47_9EUKA
MTLIGIDFVFLLLSIFLTMILTDRILSPERLLLGLKIVLPPQQVSTKETNKDKKEDKEKKRKTEFYLRFEKIRSGVPSGLYFYKDYDNLVSLGFITAVNYVFSLLFEQYTGRDSLWALLCQILLILISNVLSVGISPHLKDTTQGVVCFWFSVVSFLVSLIFMQQNNRLVIFNVDEAYQEFKTFVDVNILDYYAWTTRMPSEPLLFKFVLAFLSGLLSYTCFTPIVNSIRCHWYFGSNIMMEQTKKTKKVIAQKYLSYLNLILPFMTACMFLRPIYDMFVSKSMYRASLLWLLFLTGTVRLLFVRPYFQSYMFSVLSKGLESATIAKESISSSAKVDFLQKYLLKNFKFMMIVVIELLVIPFILITFSAILNNKGHDYMFINHIAEFIPQHLPFVDSLNSFLNHNLWSALERGSLQYFVQEVVGFLSFWTCSAMTLMNICCLIYNDTVDRWFRREESKRSAERRSRRQSISSNNT